MGSIIEAIYEKGMLKPLEPLNLQESQHVLLELRVPLEADADRQLQAWRQVYDGLSEEEIGDVEAVALDRSRFRS